MPKFYVTDAKLNLLIQRPDQREAAEAFVMYWLGKGKKLGKVIGMNEEGFDTNNVDTDSVFKTSEIIASTK